MTKVRWPRWHDDCHGIRPYRKEFCPTCAGERAEAEAQREAQTRGREREAYEETDALKIEMLGARINELESQYVILAVRMFRALSVLRSIAPEKMGGGSMTESQEWEKDREAYEQTDAFKIEQLATTMALTNEQMNILNARIGLLAKRLDRLEEALFHED